MMGRSILLAVVLGVVLSFMARFVSADNITCQLYPYAHYTMNEESGINVTDYSGNNFTGFGVNSPTWVVGKLNNSVQFNGNQYINLSDRFKFERTEPFSIEAWIYPTTAVGQQGIVGNALGTAPYTGWDVSYNSQKISVFLINSYSGDTLMVSTINTYPVSQWSHIIVTYDGTSTPSGIKIYVNGTLQSTATNFNSLSGSLLNSVSSKIGWSVYNLYPFYGKIDEVVIYNNTITPEDVTFRWNNTYGTESMNCYYGTTTTTTVTTTTTTTTTTSSTSTTSTTTTTTICTQCQEKIFNAIGNQTEVLVSVTINQTTIIVDAINNQTFFLMSGLDNNTQEIVWAINNQSGAQSTILDKIYLLLLDTLEVQSKDVDHYNIQVSADSNFTTLSSSRFAAASDFKISDLNLPDGSYYARVRAYDADTKKYGRWSATLAFYVNGSVTS